MLLLRQMPLHTYAQILCFLQNMCFLFAYVHACSVTGQVGRHAADKIHHLRTDEAEEVKKAPPVTHKFWFEKQ